MKQQANVAVKEAAVSGKSHGKFDTMKSNGDVVDSGAYCGGGESMKSAGGDPAKQGYHKLEDLEMGESGEMSSQGMPAKGNKYVEIDKMKK